MIFASYQTGNIDSESGSASRTEQIKASLKICFLLVNVKVYLELSVKRLLANFTSCNYILSDILESDSTKITFTRQLSNVT